MDFFPSLFRQRWRDIGVTFRPPLMAGLRKKGDSWYCEFRYQNQRYNFTIGEVPEEIAEATGKKVDLILYRLKQRLVEIPAGTSVIDFIQFEGKPAPISVKPVPVQPTAVGAAKTVTLGAFRDQYLKAHCKSLEKSTLDGIELHFKYFADAWGEDFLVFALSLQKLQEYVDGRLDDPGRNGRTLSAATVKKEIVTLRTAWNYAKTLKIVGEPFPYKGLRYPRMTEKPPFMTKSEIEKRINAGGLDEAEKSDLWDAMYPTADEIPTILDIVKSKTAQPFVYPMVGTAAYTGARRSELLRARVTDVNLEERVFTIHEKKRVRGRNTTRRVPIAGTLYEILEAWLKIHPGGQFLFCQSGTVSRSKKRSAITGYAGRNRATTSSGRMLGLTVRATQPMMPLTKDEAHNHLKNVLKDTEWSKIKGWHFFRHSFIGACATQSVDQCYIDEWVGHQTEEQRKRYRHLAPSSQRNALTAVFA